MVGAAGGPSPQGHARLLEPGGRAVRAPSLRAVLWADEGRGEKETYLLPISNANH